MWRIRIIVFTALLTLGPSAKAAEACSMVNFCGNCSASCDPPYHAYCEPGHFDPVTLHCFRQPTCRCLSQKVAAEVMDKIQSVTTELLKTIPDEPSQ